jgi:LPXTG-motif cell wall-anchored protein
MRKKNNKTFLIIGFLLVAVAGAVMAVRKGWFAKLGMTAKKQ